LIDFESSISYTSLSMFTETITVKLRVYGHYYSHAGVVHPMLRYYGHYYNHAGVVHPMLRYFLWNVLSFSSTSPRQRQHV